MEAVGQQVESRDDSEGRRLGTREEEEARRARQLEDDLKFSQRERTRDNVRMAGGIVLSLVLALPVMASSAAVRDVDLGWVLLYSGLALGQIGVLASVLWGLHRAVKRGDTDW